MPLSVSARDLEKEETGNRLHVKKPIAISLRKKKKPSFLVLSLFLSV